MTNSAARILLVEDDRSLGFLISEILTDAGYLVNHCITGEEAIRALGKYKVDLCLLDVMLPTYDGFTLAKKIKALNLDVPFLFLTARSLKEDAIKGYELGADDYITKPFDQDLLLYKIKAVLGRISSKAASAETQKLFQIGNFTFDYEAHSLVNGKSKLRLTEKENEVLFLLCSNLNRVVRRDEAVERIYGKRDYFLGRSFDVFISKIRKYLSADPSLQIENVYRVGFILTDSQREGRPNA